MEVGSRGAVTGETGIHLLDGERVEGWKSLLNREVETMMTTSVREGSGGPLYHSPA